MELCSRTEYTKVKDTIYVKKFILCLTKNGYKSKYLNNYFPNLKHFSNNVFFLEFSYQCGFSVFSHMEYPFVIIAIKIVCIPLDRKL